MESSPLGSKSCSLAHKSRILALLLLFNSLTPFSTLSLASAQRVQGLPVLLFKLSQALPAEQCKSYIKIWTANMSCKLSSVPLPFKKADRGGISLAAANELQEVSKPRCTSRRLSAKELASRFWSQRSNCDVMRHRGRQS